MDDDTECDGVVTTVAGHDYRAWAAAGLPEPELDRATFVNERDDGFGSSAGEWWIDGVLPDGRPYIMYGTYGNYNSPGASHYTHADVFCADADGREEHALAVAKWEAKPEMIDTGDEDEDEDGWDDDDDEEGDEEDGGDDE